MNGPTGLIAVSLLATAALMLVLSGCERGEDDTQPQPQSPTQESALAPAAEYDLSSEPLQPQFGGEIVALSVEGMTCNVCANAVGKALVAVEGVRSGRVSLEGKRAWVEVDAEAGPSAQRLSAAVAAIPNAHYTAAPLTDVDPVEAESTDG